MPAIYNAIRYLRYNRIQFLDSIVTRLSFLFPDKIFLSLRFKFKMGRWIDWANPQTFSEKLQWLKIYNRNPLYTTMVDKYAVKEHVGRLISDKYIIPTIACWPNPDSIDWNILPDKFVLKTTHGGGGGGVVICKDIKTFDKTSAISKLRNSYKGEIYINYREWPYKNVKKQVIAEELLIPEDGDLKDYKVLCFNGKPRLIEYHSGRFTDSHTQDFYDTEWNRTDITQGGYGDMAKEPAPKPACLEEMLTLCEVLAKDMPHVRIDWYYCNERLYFGEITFFDGSGLEPFDRVEDELLLGSWIDLNMAYSRIQKKK